MAIGLPRHRPILLLLFLLTLPVLLLAQQPYIAKAGDNCTTSPSPTLGFSCNSSSASCSAFLTFRSIPPYDTLPAISTLLSSSLQRLRLSNPLLPSASPVPANTLVFVPVNCSCSAARSQSNSTYKVAPSDTLKIIANSTFQGLSTCQAIAAQNAILHPELLQINRTLVVPLRCACPTPAQAREGVRYLLSYLVEWGNTVDALSRWFGVEPATVLSANELTQEPMTIYPFTTLLIPLKSEPNTSLLAITPPPPPQPPPPPPSPEAPTGTHKSKTWAYVLAGVAAAAAVVIGLSAFVYCKMGRKRGSLEAGSPAAAKLFDGMPDPPSGLEKQILLRIPDAGLSLKVYKFAELQQATGNFSPGSAITRSVYRGVFDGGAAAAVKRMGRDISKEIEILRSLNHTSLIGLSGFCHHHGEWFLVLEYAENGSLGEWLFDASGSKVLNWFQRVRIALDVANGLNYLHNYTMPAYVHKDINCANVLLDGSFRARISNFGLARPAEGAEDEPVLTRHIVGTLGYLAPEYLELGVITPKLDVYALGVMMMEMITGKEVVVSSSEGEVPPSREKLVEIFGRKDGAEEGLLGACIDPRLEGSYRMSSASVMARLVADCLSGDMADRPTMVKIIQTLSGVLADSTSWYLSSSSGGLRSPSSGEEVQSKDDSFSVVSLST